MLIDLINGENSTTLDESMFDILPISTETGKVGFGTKAPLQWRTTENMIGLLNVYYNRVDLGTLFSLTGISLKEVNLTCDAEGKVVFDDLFYAEISRRYGVNCTAADFDIVLNAEGAYVFKAKAENLAYIGEQVLGIEASLETRVQATILDGFVFVDEHDIGLVLVLRENGSITKLSNYVDNKALTLTATYNLDCSEFSNLLELTPYVPASSHMDGLSYSVPLTTPNV